MIEIIKNPVIIGLTIGILTYIYLRWEQSKNPLEKNKRKDTNLLIPLGLGVASWFIAHNYFEDYNFTNDQEGSNYVANIIDAGIPPKIQIESGFGGGDASLVNNINSVKQVQNSYHVLKRGVSVPQSFDMPDVLLENF